MVLALRKAGSDLPNLSPSHLSPLPVTVPTHSLNLEKPNLAPTYFFVFIIFIPFTSPLKIHPLTLFNVIVRLTYLSPTATPIPYVPLPEGNEGGLASCTEAQHKPLDGLLAIQRSIYPEWVQRPTTSEGMDGAEGYTSYTSLTI